MKNKARTLLALSLLSLFVLSNCKLETDELAAPTKDNTIENVAEIPKVTSYVSTWNKEITDTASLYPNCYFGMYNIDKTGDYLHGEKICDSTGGSNCIYSLNGIYNYESEFMMATKLTLVDVRGKIICSSSKGTTSWVIDLYNCTQRSGLTWLGYKLCFWVTGYIYRVKWPNINTLIDLGSGGTVTLQFIVDYLWDGNYASIPYYHKITIP